MTVELTALPSACHPRACDCDFCIKHGAAYISDPDGCLRIRIKERELLRFYRQGSATAECLICGNCGVLVGVIYQSEGKTFGTLNVGAVDRNAEFGERTLVSPRLLSANEKVERWKRLWFGDVTLEYNAEASVPQGKTNAGDVSQATPPG